MARQMPKIDPKALTAVYQRAAMIGRLIREQGMTPTNINRLRECIRDLRKLGAVHPQVAVTRGYDNLTCRHDR